MSLAHIAEQYFEKALTAIRGRDNGRAAALLIEAIKAKPDFAEAWVVRGNCLHADERHFDSILHYDRALNINDGMHDAWNNRGIAFADIGMWASAEESFRKSMVLLDAVEPHVGLANMYCTLMRLEEAAAEYQRCIEIDPGFLDARFNLGVTLLGLGKWEEGFREYEWRWKNTPYPPRSYRNYAKWQGEDLAGKRILLYPEQGYGDEILALRFANLVHERWPDATVIVQARAPMLRVARASMPEGVAVMPMHEESGIEAIPIDYSCPLLDVPMAMGLSWRDVPRPERYLSADPVLKADWAQRLRPGTTRLFNLPPGLNVGLCWSSGGHLNTARAAQLAKSIPLHWLKPLVMPGVNLISLQIPQEPIPADMPITDWTQDIHSFADTAALIEALDVVISVDTSVAHLAGALGKPCMNFVRFSGYWPWLAPNVAPNPEYSIWYPSMVLLRQPRLGDWDTPIKEAVERLQKDIEWHVSDKKIRGRA